MAAMDLLVIKYENGVYEYNGVLFCSYKTWFKQLKIFGLGVILKYGFVLIKKNSYKLVRSHDVSISDLNFYINFICLRHCLRNKVRDLRIEFNILDNPTKYDYRVTFVYNTTVIHNTNRLIFIFPRDDFTVCIHLINSKLLFFYDIKCTSIYFNYKFVDGFLTSFIVKNLSDFNVLIMEFDSDVENFSNYVVFTKDMFTYGDENIDKLGGSGEYKK